VPVGGMKNFHLGKGWPKNESKAGIFQSWKFIFFIQIPSGKFRFK